MEVKPNAFQSMAALSKEMMSRILEICKDLNKNHSARVNRPKLRAMPPLQSGCIDGLMLLCLTCLLFPIPVPP